MENSEPLAVPGIRLAATCAGIKYSDRLDLVLLELAPGSAVAGTFTRNAFCAAPVQLARERLAQLPPRYFLINTGNANAGTGDAGLAAARDCCLALARQVGVTDGEVLPFSTGVIGEHLPVDVITAALPALVDGLDAGLWPSAAEGILTTDTRPKLASVQLALGDSTVTLTGMAKGAGMLRPDMATMLAFVATDAAVEPALLQRLWVDTVEGSFNRVTVDGDTSTNDAAMLVATGAAGGPVIDSESHPHYAAFGEALGKLALQLAQGLVRDGEGASKFVTVAVSGGCDQDECLEVAYTIAHSPLVKTALFAGDPNWGRLLAAIGRAGVRELDVDRVSVSINGVLIAEGGCRAPGYTEEQGVAAMAGSDIEIAVDLQRGDAEVRVWTSDLSYDYVRINAEYRT